MCSFCTLLFIFIVGYYKHSMSFAAYSLPSVRIEESAVIGVYIYMSDLGRTISLSQPVEL